MKKYFVGVLCASVLALAVVAPVAKAETTATTPTVASLMEILQGLLKQVEELQKKLRETQGEIQAVQKEIKSGLREGVEDEDVRKIQELLATNPELYPRGLITGYYGPLTSEAIKRFQERNGLTVTGVVDDETRDYLEEYYGEYKANRGAAALWAQEKRMEMKKRIAERKMEREEKREERKEYRNDDDDEEDEDRPALVTKALAQRAILAATTAIENLEDELEVTTADEDDVSEATEDLADAEENLDKAERALAANRYRIAYDYAMKARKDAREGLEELSDDDDDDDDDEDEDDDDEEDD